jgi:hypothetical protein
MPLSHEYKFIYVHIPKCAGKSITKAIRQQNVHLDFLGATLPQHRDEYGISDLWLHHLPASSLQKILHDEVWKGYFKFAFVRNPWDLVVSYYHYHKKEFDESAEFHQHWPSIAERFRRTSNFVDWLHTGLYIQPHVNFLTDGGTKLLVDFVGRFENLHEDFRSVCARVGLHARLGHENQTEHAHYREYYDTATREIVRERFQRDIELFGYEF